MVSVVTPPEPEELELEDDVLLPDELEELLELLDEELLLEDEELLEDELLLLLELEELEELDEPPPEPLGIEHSLMPPGTRVPAPKVASPQTKLPFSVMKVN